MLSNVPSEPRTRLILTPHDAEVVAAEWMAYRGFADAAPTRVGPDSGIDVNSSEAVAQVKMQGIKTSRPLVQALFGVATAERKQGLFFSLGGYTLEANEWAIASLLGYKPTVDWILQPASKKSVAKATPKPTRNKGSAHNLNYGFANKSPKSQSTPSVRAKPKPPAGQR